MKRHLRDAIARDDTERVAFWAYAINGWDRPVPEYEDVRAQLNQFSLTERAGAHTSESARNSGISGSLFARKNEGSGGSSEH
jgi:hypothetical protein